MKVGSQRLLSPESSKTPHSFIHEGEENPNLDPTDEGKLPTTPLSAKASKIHTSTHRRCSRSLRIHRLPGNSPFQLTPPSPWQPSVSAHRTRHSQSVSRPYSVLQPLSSCTGEQTFLTPRLTQSSSGTLPSLLPDVLSARAIILSFFSLFLFAPPLSRLPANQILGEMPLPNSKGPHSILVCHTSC